MIEMTSTWTRVGLTAAVCLFGATLWGSIAWSEANKIDGIIPARFDTPPGFETGSFENPEKIKIRYGHLPVASGEAKAVIVLVGGKGEMMEKYFETFRDLSARGLDIWTMDWPGQGGSGRYLADPVKPGAVDYALRIRDLESFISTNVPKPADKPRYLFAHSMGGNLALRYLHDYPGRFDALIFTAPMININTGKVPEWLARSIVRLGTWLGFGDSYFPGVGAVDPKTGYDFAKSGISSDPERDTILYDWFVKDPSLRTSGSTFVFLNEALNSINVLAEEGYLEKIDLPVLLGTPLIDIYVRPDAQTAACKRLPKCQQFVMAQSKHEPWMERDEIRNAWLAEVDKFLGEQLAKAGQ